MTENAKGIIELKSFDEETYADLDAGAKLTRARIVQTLRGDLSGETTIDCLMYYAPDGTATVVGLERFVGTLAGRSGTFVQQSTAAYGGTEVHATAKVLAGSGTGDLRSVRGDGTWAAPHGSTGSYTLDYDLG